MIRIDAANVDFGVWKNLDPAQLCCPLDVPSGTTARKLGLLKRKQNYAKVLAEYYIALWEIDYKDPVKYDYELY